MENSLNTEAIISLLKVGYADEPILDNKDSKLPTIIVPDIHARWEFVNHVLQQYATGEYNIVFTGDILHSEGDDNKWESIELYYIRKCEGRIKDVPQDMKEELDNSFYSLQLILEAKQKLPDNIFLLRGNHDDISCRLQGDYGKYARVFLESTLFRETCKKTYPELLKAYYEYEKHMPYLYIGTDFLASHALPDAKVKKKEIKLDDKRTHWRFSWADNTDYGSASVYYFNDNIKELNPMASYWFCGHRPVSDGLLRLQCAGRLVQNNHPDRWVIIEKPFEEPYEVFEINAPL